MTHRTRLTFACILIAGLVLLNLAGCSSTAPIEGAAAEEILAFADPKADDLFAGLNNNDYTAFSRHFDEKMGQAMTEASLADIQGEIIAKIGKYLSRSVTSIEESGPYITVIYSARFELEDPVTVRLVFEKGGEHRISGLWFDSPKLREQ